MQETIGDRLRESHRARFVGRVRELAGLREAREAGRAAVMLHGVAGVGKTTLLREFESRCTSEGISTVRIDAREVAGNPEAVREAHRRLAGDRAPGETLVLQLDNYETWAPLDRWIRDSFLPELPAGYFVVIAGRMPPSAGWRDDPAWRDLFQAMPIGNLSREESSEYLRGRAVPEVGIPDALAFTGGHPLALSLVAEFYTEPAGAGALPSDTPDVVQALVERFLEAVPDDDHRRALEISALARATTEGLLARALPGADAFAKFSWLKGLSFMERGRFGLAPHDLARTAIVADLRWRNRARLEELRGAIRIHYREALGQLSGKAQAAILLDYIYLHRENPGVAQAFQFDSEAGGYADAMRPDDPPALVEMVFRHEGEGPAALAAHWLAVQPANVVVFRSGSSAPAGFVLQLAVEAINPEDAARDPAAAHVGQFLARHAPLRTGERATLFRFWMDSETYQAPSPTQSLIFLQIVRHLLTTPRLAVTIIPCREPDLWAPVFAYAGFPRVPDADYVLDGTAFGAYVSDWRLRPPLEWLDMSAGRERVPDAVPEAEQKPSAGIITRSEFEAALARALKDWRSSERLKASPLLRSRMVAARSAKTGEDAVRSLQELIKEAALTMRAEAKDQKLLRALRACYFESAPSQDAAAEKLEIGVATLRRHLKEGSDRVVSYLWDREIGL